MQRCFLVINKETQVASYLQHRSILEVVEEHRSLSELNMEKLDIVDVDKFLYIYYRTDDSDLSFRSDMNALRNLLGSAFFHVSEAMFILVNNENPLLEDLIHSALRNTKMPRDKIEVIQHSGSLMLADVGKYLAGSVSGQTTSSSYRDVFIREAEREEKERYVNSGTGIESVLPVLTDMAAIYAQRASVEAISAGRVVTENFTRPAFVKDFSRVNVDIAKTIGSFVVSGEDWTFPGRATGYLTEYFRTVGRRCLVINLDDDLSVCDEIGASSILTLMDIKSPITTEASIAIINARFNQLGYIVGFLGNINGVEQYIFNVSPEDYGVVSQLVSQLSEKMYNIFVAHYNRRSLLSYVNSGIKSTALFLSFEHFKEEFGLKAFKDDLKGTVVAEFPESDVDYIEFFDFATGGGLND